MPRADAQPMPWGPVRFLGLRSRKQDMFEADHPGRRETGRVSETAQDPIASKSGLSVEVLMACHSPRRQVSSALTRPCSSQWRNLALTASADSL